MDDDMPARPPEGSRDLRADPPRTAGHEDRGQRGEADALMQPFKHSGRVS